MAYLYLELLKDSLNEYAYAAELAGLNYDLQNTVYGMYVSIRSLLLAHNLLLLRIPDLMSLIRIIHKRWLFVFSFSFILTLLAVGGIGHFQLILATPKS